jgi:hypothetical protein
VRDKVPSSYSARRSVQPLGIRSMKKETQLRIVVIIAACWIILMPPIWAKTLSMQFGFDYFEFLALYIPELVVAVACLILLPGAWARKGWAVVGLVVAAVLLPIIKQFVGSPTSSTWFISSALMLLVAVATWSQRRENA